MSDMWSNTGFSIAKELVHSTEDDVFQYGAVRDLDELDEHDGDDDRSLEAMGSWDGTPVGIDELAHIAAFGHADSGFDRPVQLSESERLEREIANRDATLGIMQRQVGELQMRADPMRLEREAQQRADLEDEIATHPGQAREIILAQRAQIADREARSVNTSLGAAHERYGEDFEAAYKALTTQDHNDPIARATVQRIWDAPDSGKALMHWYGGQTSHRSGLIPSLNSQDRGGGSYRGERSSGRSRSADDWSLGDDAGGTDPSAESAIFDSAAR